MTDSITLPIKNQRGSPTKRERLATECVCCGNIFLKKSPAVLMPFVAHRIFGWEPIQIDESWGLETIQNGTAYIICNSTLCNNCGFLFLDLRFSDKELEALYNGYRDEEYTSLREKYEPGYKLRNHELALGINYIREVEEFLSSFLIFPVNILDWGGDTGKNTPFKENHGVLHIYDISQKKPEIGEIIEKEKTLKRIYDLVVCSHVLEHIPYPSNLILEIMESMNEKTILYIEVPYEDLMIESDANSNLHLKKRHWHEHINFFSKESLIKLLNSCGLDILKIKQREISGVLKKSSILQIACKLSKSAPSTFKNP